MYIFISSLWFRGKKRCVEFRQSARNNKNNKRNASLTNEMLHMNSSTHPAWRAAGAGSVAAAGGGAGGGGARRCSVCVPHDPPSSHLRRGYISADPMHPRGGTNDTTETTKVTDRNPLPSMIYARWKREIKKILNESMFPFVHKILFVNFPYHNTIILVTLL